VPRKSAAHARRLRASVPRGTQELLEFVNADREIAGDDAEVRRDFKGWLHRLAAGEQLPFNVVHPPYELNFGSVGSDLRSALD
jgi:hypothetical protein